MAYKATTLCLIIALVFFFFFSSQASAIRPEPAFPDVIPLKNLHGDVEEATKKVDQTVEDSCDGVEGDDCLMRRALAAHIDYIYTQKSKP
ncbi:hypothetical protein AB3S75_043614 [Citrus x aurantiifolia]